MTLYDFLKHPDMQLPSQWDSCKDFEAYFGSRLDGFLTLIEKLKPDFVSDEVHKRKHTIISFCNELRRSLRSSFQGHSSEAYKHFDTAMKSILPDMPNVTIEVTDQTDLGILYRVRQTLSASLQTAEMFHLPFELRHLLSPVENGGAFRGKIWVKMAAHMCAVRRSDKMGRQPHFERLQRGSRKCEEIWTSGSRFARTCW